MPMFLSHVEVETLNRLYLGYLDAIQHRVAAENSYSPYIVQHCPRGHIIRLLAVDEDKLSEQARKYGGVDKVPPYIIVRECKKRGKFQTLRKNKKITDEEIVTALRAGTYTCKICGLEAKVYLWVPPDICRTIVKHYHMIEEAHVEGIRRIVEKHPLWTCYLRYVRGIGIIHAALIIWVLERNMPRKVTSLWRYLGLYPWGVCENTLKGKCDYVLVEKYDPDIDKTCPKCGGRIVPKLPTKRLASLLGRQLDFSPQLRARVRVMFESLRLAGGVYARLYKMHHYPKHGKNGWIETVKILLSHAWEVFWKLAGVDVKPYIKQHDRYIPPLIDVRKLEDFYRTDFYENIWKRYYEDKYDISKIYKYWLDIELR